MVRLGAATPVLIDTDPGTDDAIARLFAVTLVPSTSIYGARPSLSSSHEFTGDLARICTCPEWDGRRSTQSQKEELQ